MPKFRNAIENLLTKLSFKKTTDKKETPCKAPAVPLDQVLESAQQRQTVRDLPALSISGGYEEPHVHWFDGQSKYRTGNKSSQMSSDSWARLESFLATRSLEELKALDPGWEKDY